MYFRNNAGCEEPSNEIGQFTFFANDSESETFPDDEHLGLSNEFKAGALLMTTSTKKPIDNS